jgi:hypothetical protein
MQVDKPNVPQSAATSQSARERVRSRKHQLKSKPLPRRRIIIQDQSLCRTSSLLAKRILILLLKRDRPTEMPMRSSLLPRRRLLKCKLKLLPRSKLPAILLLPEDLLRSSRTPKVRESILVRPDVAREEKEAAVAEVVREEEETEEVEEEEVASTEMAPMPMVSQLSRPVVKKTTVAEAEAEEVEAEEVLMEIERETIDLAEIEEEEEKDLLEEVTRAQTSQLLRLQLKPLLPLLQTPSEEPGSSAELMSTD